MIIWCKRIALAALTLATFLLIGAAMVATAEEQADSYPRSAMDAGSGHSSIMGD